MVLTLATLHGKPTYIAFSLLSRPNWYYNLKSKKATKKCKAKQFQNMVQQSLLEIVWSLVDFFMYEVSSNGNLKIFIKTYQVRREFVLF